MNTRIHNHASYLTAGDIYPSFESVYRGFYSNNRQKQPEHFRKGENLLKNSTLKLFYLGYFGVSDWVSVIWHFSREFNRHLKTKIHSIE